MLRWTFRIFTFFSFALFGACLALWGRSYFITDVGLFTTTSKDGLVFTERVVGLDSGSGGMHLHYTVDVSTTANEEEAGQRAGAMGPARLQRFEINGSAYGGILSDHRRGKLEYGFASGREKRTVNENIATVRWLVFPHAAAALLSGIVPIFKIILFIKRRRRRKRLEAVNYHGIELRQAA